MEESSIISSQNNRKNFNIYIAAHKPFDPPKDSTYIPLQVGSAPHSDLGFIRDSDGDSISAENESFCELTGLYWIWKNTSDEYTGLVHYRRYFYGKNWPVSGKMDILSGSEAIELLKKYDILLPERGYTWGTTVRRDYFKNHIKSDLILTEKIIKERHPEYSEAFDVVFNGNHYSQFNMIITRRQILNDYCAWLFDILFILKRHLIVPLQTRTPYEKRVFGFLAERLLNVWICKNSQYTIKELPVYNLERNLSIQKAETAIKKYLIDPFTTLSLFHYLKSL